MAETHTLPLDDLNGRFYHLAGPAAIEHLGRVAAGLDAMILGEPQILGQVAEAFALAAAREAADPSGVDPSPGEPAAGPVLSALFRAAIHAGKRAHAETAISRGSGTLGSVAVKLAETTVGPLADRQVLVVGAGEMAELAVEALRSRGVSQITVANRTLERATALAERWGARATTFEHLSEALAAADIALSSTGAPHWVITPAVAGPALAARPERPLVLIDIAVPRDVDPEVRRRPDVRYYDIDDLEAHLNGALAERQQAVPLVEAIVAEEMGKFSDWLSEAEMAPLIAALHARADAIARAEVDKTLRHMPHLTVAERAQIEVLAQSLVSKLLHDPTRRLKAVAGHGQAADYAAAVRDLFALND